MNKVELVAAVIDKAELTKKDSFVGSDSEISFCQYMASEVSDWESEYDSQIKEAYASDSGYDDPELVEDSLRAELSNQLYALQLICEAKGVCSENMEILFSC